MFEFPTGLKELESWLKKRDNEYYNQDAPSVSDAVYDSAVAYWKTLTGKTWEVLGNASKEFTRIPHVVPMLSLEKVTSIDELVSWTPHAGDYILTPKIDGMACRLTYINGKLVEAVSRGDGTVGESIIHSLKPIIGTFIPATLSGVPAEFYVSGEIYLPTDLFAIVGGSNPRNVAAGLVRRKTSSGDQKHLRFIAYSVVGSWQSTYANQLELLSNYGFDTPPFKQLNHNDFSSYTIEKFNPDAWHTESLIYEIDGAVISVNDIDYRERLGETSHHPRWACAVKFEVKTAVSTLLAVEWNASRTGVIVPTAIFEAVNLCGTIVTRATMHNFEHYQKMNIRVGEQIIIAKQGDIIPAVKGKYFS